MYTIEYLLIYITDILRIIFNNKYKNSYHFKHLQAIFSNKPEKTIKIHKLRTTWT